MTSETLILDDLPHLAEEVRRTGYRSAMSEKEGTIKLDEEEVPASPPKQEKITSWQLVKAVWEGRGFVVFTSEPEDMHQRKALIIRCDIRSDPSVLWTTPTGRPPGTDRLFRRRT
jgi:hypothetical protein